MLSLADKFRLQKYGSNFMTSIYNICNYIDEYIRKTGETSITININTLLKLTSLTSNSSFTPDKLNVLNTIYVDNIQNYLNLNGLLTKYNKNTGLKVYGWNLVSNLSDDFLYLYSAWYSKSADNGNVVALVSAKLETYIVRLMGFKLRACDKIEIDSDAIGTWVKEIEAKDNIRIGSNKEYGEILDRVIDDLRVYGFTVVNSQEKLPFYVFV